MKVINVSTLSEVNAITIKYSTIKQYAAKTQNHKKYCALGA